MTTTHTPGIDLLDRAIARGSNPVAIHDGLKAQFVVLVDAEAALEAYAEATGSCDTGAVGLAGDHVRAAVSTLIQTLTGYSRRAVDDSGDPAEIDYDFPRIADTVTVQVDPTDLTTIAAALGGVSAYVGAQAKAAERLRLDRVPLDGLRRTHASLTDALAHLTRA